MYIPVANDGSAGVPTPKTALGIFDKNVMSQTKAARPVTAPISKIFDDTQTRRPSSRVLNVPGGAASKIFETEDQFVKTSRRDVNTSNLAFEFDHGRRHFPGDEDDKNVEGEHGRKHYVKPTVVVENDSQRKHFIGTESAAVETVEPMTRRLLRPNASDESSVPEPVEMRQRRDPNARSIEPESQ